MSKKLSKESYRFLLNELNHQKNRGIITKNQVDDMMDFYEESQGMSFIKILVTIGALLIGLGILSFVASNWAYIGKVTKMIMIVGAIGCSIFTSFKVEKNYPKTSKSMLYLSVLIYGAGIFLIGQMFNYGGDFTGAFLLWTIGVLPMSFMMRDKILCIFAHILASVYIGGSFNENIIIYSLILIVIFYIANKYLHYSKIITFFNNALAIYFIVYLLDYMNVNFLYGVLIFLGIGLFMHYKKHNLNVDIFKLQGMILIGVSGLSLTFSRTWRDLSFITDRDSVAIVCGIVLLIYLLSLVREGHLIPLVFTCILILRYYFDTLYDFMPKSLFFIIGGVILLGFGHYFERLRKNSGGELDEENS